MEELNTFDFPPLPPFVRPPLPVNAIPYQDSADLDGLLYQIGPSGHEEQASAAWREIAEERHLSTATDRAGNSFAFGGNEAGRRVMLDGHIDEIGFIVHAIDEKGFLRIRPIGGWDAAQAVGQHVVILGTAIPDDTRQIEGVVGRDAVHILEHPIKPPKLEKLWVDIGAKDRDDALTMIQVGDALVIDTWPRSTGADNSLLVSRALDDRVGAFIVLAAVARYHEWYQTLASLAQNTQVCAIACASVQEEVGLRGARIAAEGQRPEIAIAVDVCHATDYPGADKDEYGERALGSGPALSRAVFHSPIVYRALAAAATRAGVAYTVIPEPASTGTNGDSITMASPCAATAVMSIPLRYMHSPVETCSIIDIESAIRLLTEFLKTAGTLNLLAR